MTGAFVRIQRDGKWQNVEPEQMTDAELEAWAATLDIRSARAWLACLAAWIRDNVQEGGPGGGPVGA